MNFDDWRTETPEDYEDRMHVHDQGGHSLPPASGGPCRECGKDTTSSVARVGWICHACIETLREQQARNEDIYVRAIRREFQR